jgi:hypothetical protein
MGCGGSKKSNVFEPSNIYKGPHDPSTTPASPKLINVQDEYLRNIPIPDPSPDFQAFLNQLATHLSTSSGSISINYSSSNVGYRPIRTQQDYEEVFNLMKFQKVKVNAVVKNQVGSGFPIEYGMFKLYKVQALNNMQGDAIESDSRSILNLTIEMSKTIDKRITAVWHNYLQIFNIKERQIDKKHDSRFNLNSRAMLYINGNIIVTGGNKDCSIALEYNPRTETINRLPNLLQGRERHSMACLGSYIYVIGGFHHKALSSCEFFDGKSWDRISDLNIARHNHSSVNHNEYIYVVGGKQQDSIEKWDGIAWKLLTVKLPMSVSKPGLASMGMSSILIVGGSSGPPLESVWTLDTTSESLEVMPNLPNGDMFSSSGVSIKYKIYFMGNTGIYIFNTILSQWDKLETVSNNELLLKS